MPPDAIRALRQRLGLSRAAFALRYGLIADTVREWEDGSRLPSRAACVLLTLIDRAPEEIAALLAVSPSV
jgi:putative transcriptional regulator